MNYQQSVTAGAAGLIFLVLIICGITVISFDVSGNISNGTLTARAYIWNTQPNITQIIISPDPIILTPCNTTLVNCTAYVTDYNSWGDIQNVSAQLYDISLGPGLIEDQNFRYINSSCQNCTPSGSDPTNATCTCLFPVWYYANNGTWACNITVSDKGGNATSRYYYLNDSKLSNVNISPILGINVPSEIDFGNLSVTEISDNLSANVSNWGNVPINITIRGWGGTEPYGNSASNYTMLCQYGNITHGYLKYAPNSTAIFSQMTNLTNNSVLIPQYRLPVRTNDSHYGNDTNTTYWRLEIPLSVGGLCNGTVEFTAIDATV
jgi:hypothetical protein